MSDSKIFIASSSKALPFATGLKKNLEDNLGTSGFEVDTWKNANWKHLYSYFDSLVGFFKEEEKYQYVIFLLHPDDKIRSESQDDNKTTRGNVLFELGLCLGLKGRDKTFVLSPEENSSFKQISDLKGINLYDYNLESDNHESATEIAALKISKQIIEENKNPTQLHNPIIVAAMDVLTAEIRKTLNSTLTTYFASPNMSLLSEHITPMIREAKKEILIACDFPAYAAYSQPNESSDYIDQLVGKALDFKRAQEPEINMKVYCESRREKQDLLKEPLLSEEWESAKNDQIKKSLIEELSKDVYQKNNAIESKEQFKDAILEQQKKRLGTLNDMKVVVKEIDKHMPVHIWIADQAAVFSLPNSEKGLTQFGFCTRDHNLIETLRSIWKSYETDKKNEASAS